MLGSVTIQSTLLWFTIRILSRTTGKPPSASVAVAVIELLHFMEEIQMNITAASIFAEIQI